MTSHEAAPTETAPTETDLIDAPPSATVTPPADEASEAPMLQVLAAVVCCN